MKQLLLIFFIISTATANAQQEILTNQSIVDMLELGFANDVIVAKINISKANFDTSIQALKNLKEKGVSDGIIVAIMQRSKQNEGKETREQNAKTGIYFKEGNELKKLLPTAILNSKSNTLESNITPRISNTKIKSVLANEHSVNLIKTNVPEFYFYFGDIKRTEIASGYFSVSSSPSEFVLVKLESKKGKREIKTGEVDLYSGNFVGVESKDFVTYNIEVISENEFRITPKEPLSQGEYCFFYQGVNTSSYKNNQIAFDFSISEGCTIENRHKINDSVWVLKQGKPKKLEVMSVNIKNDGIYYSLRSRNSWKDEEYKESECFSSKDEIKSK